MTTDTELRAAAEEIARIMADEGAGVNCARDVEAVLRKHISTVPADDDEPHTVAWLIEQGAIEQPNRTVAGFVVCSFHLPDGRRLHICGDGHIGFGVRRKEGVWAEGTCKTKGDVRQACKLLAINLPTKPA